MDLGLVAGAAFVLYVGFEIYTAFASAKQLREHKAKTGRYSAPWNTLHPIQKGILIVLPFLLIGLFFWLYNYSIFGPEPGELYNLEIALIGLILALTIIGSFWQVRN